MNNSFVELLMTTELSGYDPISSRVWCQFLSSLMVRPMTEPKKHKKLLRSVPMTQDQYNLLHDDLAASRELPKTLSSIVEQCIAHAVKNEREAWDAVKLLVNLQPNEVVEVDWLASSFHVYERNVDKEES